GQLYKVSGVEDWYRPIYLSYRKASTSVEAIKQVEEIVKEIDPLTAYSLQQIGSASSDANH
ncbi:LysR family transcriptional regulator, partial [Vibrio parahaemolyticus]|nr:LysR family transcriptional regulator [Vibrio parahaemolyticus]